MTPPTPGVTLRLFKLDVIRSQRAQDCRPSFACGSLPLPKNGSSQVTPRGEMPLAVCPNPQHSIKLQVCCPQRDAASRILPIFY